MSNEQCKRHLTWARDCLHQWLHTLGLSLRPGKGHRFLYSNTLRHSIQFPCFMWNLTSVHLIWFSPAFISWIFVLFFLPGSHAQCCQFLCPCRCRQISIKSKLRNWRIANLISKAISDGGPFGGIRSKTNKQTRFFSPTQIDFFLHDSIPLGIE